MAKVLPSRSWDDAVASRAGAHPMVGAKNGRRSASRPALSRLGELQEGPLGDKTNLLTRR
jgi:hypothetical protein